MPEVTVKEDGKEMTVFYPKSEDKGEEAALREHAIEKTKVDLRKRPKKVKRKLTPDEKGAIKEVNAWQRNRRIQERNHQNTRKYW